MINSPELPKKTLREVFPNKIMLFATNQTFCPPSFLPSPNFWAGYLSERSQGLLTG